jgi:hypothetical protein
MKLKRKFITFSKDKSPASIALNGYSATTIFKRPAIVVVTPSWKGRKLNEIPCLEMFAAFALP